MTAEREGKPSRRPTEARNLSILESITNALVRRGTSPNTISLLGLCAGIGAGLCFAATSMAPAHARFFWIGGGLLVVLRIAANLLDGMVALQRGGVNPTGVLWNEVPDRISDAAMLAGLGWAAGGDVVLGLTAAWVATLCAYARIQAQAAGAPADYAGPMAKPHRVVLVLLTAGYQALAPQTWQDAVHVPTLVLAVIVVGGGLTSLRRLVRAARHLEGDGS